MIHLCPCGPKLNRWPNVVPVMLQELPDAVTDADEKDVARHVPHPNIAVRSTLLPLT